MVRTLGLGVEAVGLLVCTQTMIVWLHVSFTQRIVAESVLAKH